MNIGAIVVTSRSEMIRGLVSVTRSAASEGRRLPARLGLAGRRRRPCRPTRTTSTHQRRPHRGADQADAAARSAGGSRWSTMAAATAICPTVAGQGHPGRPAKVAAGGVAPAAHPGHDQPARAPRKAKASTRWVQWSVASADCGGSTPPSHSGKPRHRRPAWKLATCAPNRMTTKPRAAVATTSRCAVVPTRWLQRRRYAGAPEPAAPPPSARPAGAWRWRGG